MLSPGILVDGRSPFSNDIETGPGVALEPVFFELLASKPNFGSLCNKLLFSRLDGRFQLGDEFGSIEDGI